LSDQSYPVEVVNGGVGDTTIIDHIYFLKKSIEIDPDIVILTFTENDIEDLGRPEPMYVSLARNRKLKSSGVLGWVYRKFRNTAVFNFGLLLKAKYGSSWNRRTRGNIEKTKANTVGELTEKYEHLLKETKAYLDKRSIPLFFVLFPSDYQFNRDATANSTAVHQLERVERFGRDIGVSTLNLLGPFKKTHLSRYDLYLLPYDGHPSKIGHSVAAEAISEGLVKSLEFLN